MVMCDLSSGAHRPCRELHCVIVGGSGIVTLPGAFLDPAATWNVIVGPCSAKRQNTIKCHNNTLFCSSYLMLRMWNKCIVYDLIVRDGCCCVGAYLETVSPYDLAGNENNELY